MNRTAGRRTVGRPDAVEHCRRLISYHSKSFALAARLLPWASRRRALVVYAWCRRNDDAIDRTGPEDQQATLVRLRRELDAVYDDNETGDIVLDAFAAVVLGQHIPRHYPEELLAGMEMDARWRRYGSLSELLEYCYRVAGTVGLMMCHAMGVRDSHALQHAAHLGIAMQLTNICRDVLEDWHLGRIYLPFDLLGTVGLEWLPDHLGGDLPWPSGRRC